MSKNIEQNPLSTEDLESFLRSPLAQSIVFYKHMDFRTIVDGWIDLGAYILDKDKGTEPRADLEEPWANIYGSKHKLDQIEGYYVAICGKEYDYLYSFETLESALAVVMDIRDKYTEAIKKSKLPYKKTVLKLTHQPSTMDITITDQDKAAEKVIQDLAKSLQSNMASFEFATSNPQRHITESILNIRTALFELAKWQNQQVKQG